MDVRVTRAEAADPEGWNRAVENSPSASVFHRYEALSVQADHADATLHPLVGRIDEELVGLFPVFEVRKGPITTAFSPPPHLRVTYLGPAMVTDGERHVCERRRRQFIEGCIDWIDGHLSARYLHIRTTEGDQRPFMWKECDVTPEYTYHVDLDRDEEDIKMSFSSDARKNIRDAEDREFTIDEGGRGAIYRIVEQVRLRYENQGIAYHVSPEFVVDLYDALPDGSVRPYELRVDGEFIGGVLALQDGNAVYRWQGGVRTDADVDLPTNDLLDWRVMADGRERGLGTYDLVGADNPRINKYKAKFNPELVAYCSIERGSLGTSVLAQAYREFRERA